MKIRSKSGQTRSTIEKYASKEIGGNSPEARRNAPGSSRHGIMINISHRYGPSDSAVSIENSLCSFRRMELENKEKGWIKDGR